MKDKAGQPRQGPHSQNLQVLILWAPLEVGDTEGRLEEVAGDWPGHVCILTTGTTYKHICRWRGRPGESGAAATRLGLMLAQFLVPRPSLSQPALIMSAS